jgi:hypothetical protein
MRKKEKEIGGPHPEAHHRALGRVPIGMESEHVSKLRCKSSRVRALLALYLLVYIH